MIVYAKSPARITKDRNKVPHTLPPDSPKVASIARIVVARTPAAIRKAKRRAGEIAR